MPAAIKSPGPEGTGAKSPFGSTRLFRPKAQRMSNEKPKGGTSQEGRGSIFGPHRVFADCGFPFQAFERIVGAGRRC
jgi:hypothetical protein